MLYLLVEEADGWRAAEPGETGELWVGGPPVGAGYVNDPVRTRAVFRVDDLDLATDAGRLYRTGDLAMFVNGVAVCSGRIDRQVKVAGVRVELDDVEAVVGRLPGVLACAVVAQGRDETTELVAHCVTESGVVMADLHALARARLPGGMAPTRWVRLDALPLNGSGKVDRRALQAGASGR